MSDFSISYSLGAPPISSSSNDADLWSFNQVALFPTAGNAMLAQPKRGGQGTLLQQEVAHALGFCRSFRSLDAHLDQIMSVMPLLREHPEDTRETLANLCKNGILESSETAWRRLTESAHSLEAGACALCVLTCDRPEALGRLLTALASKPLPGEIDRIWIIDDSRDLASVRENAGIIEGAAFSTDTEIIHIDGPQREKLLTHLKLAAPEAGESIDWLLDRDMWEEQATYGQARNLSLLLNIGKRILMLDDDILPEAIAPPLSETSLQFTTGNHREAVLWSSKEDMARQALPLDMSPLSLMLRSLGSPLAKVIANAGTTHTSLAGTDGESIAPYHANTNILISQAGYWGDTGTGDSGSWLAFMPEGTIKRVLEGSPDLEEAMGARAGWIGYRGPSLTPYGIMSAYTGVDHSSLLPPYFPAGRGEDILFGIMCQRLHPDSLVFNEGWAIRHEPIEPRQGRVPLTPLSVGPGLSTLGDWLGREPSDQWGLSPERRLSTIAGQIWRLAEMDEDARESLIRQELASRRASSLRRCMEHMGRFAMVENSPGFPQWRAFIEASRDGLLAEIQNPETTPLADWASHHAGMDSMKKGSAAFAQALEHWPAICEAAESFSP